LESELGAGLEANGKNVDQYTQFRYVLVLSVKYTREVLTKSGDHLLKERVKGFVRHEITFRSCQILETLRDT
jgi:hypothetical protein